MNDCNQKLLALNRIGFVICGGIMLKRVFPILFLIFGFSGSAYAADVGNVQLKSPGTGRISLQISVTDADVRFDKEPNAYRVCYDTDPLMINSVCFDTSTDHPTLPAATTDTFNEGDMIFVLVQCYCTKGVWIFKTTKWRRVKLAGIEVSVDDLDPDGSINIITLAADDTRVMQSKYGSAELPNVCFNEDVVFSINRPDYSSGQHLKISEFDLMVWDDVDVIHPPQWLSGPLLQNIVVNDYLPTAANRKFKTYKTYKVSLAVGPEWKVDDKLFVTKYCSTTDPLSDPTDVIAIDDIQQSFE